MVLTVLVIGAVLWLVWSNGANDNFKGVVSWEDVNWHLLANKFAQPLQLSPLLAIGLAAMLSPPVRRLGPKLGVPVSTTHVSCGAILGISAVNGNRDWRTIGRILLTWITTLPMGLTLGAGFYLVFRQMGVQS
ncbi:MAG: inorganic phosphate transporter [bacterium]